MIYENQPIHPGIKKVADMQLIKSQLCLDKNFVYYVQYNSIPVQGCPFQFLSPGFLEFIFVKNSVFVQLE